MVLFNGYKGQVYEGGFVLFMIVSGIFGVGGGIVKLEYFIVLDLVFIFLEIVGVIYFGELEGRLFVFLCGKLVLFYWKGEMINFYIDVEVFVLEYCGQVYVCKGNWKLVNFGGVYDCIRF